MRRLTLVLLASLSAASVSAGESLARPSPSPDGHPAAGVAGIYRAVDARPEAPGEASQESVLEIVPLGEDEAYVRARTMWANHHTCSMYAVFHVEHGALAYRGTTPSGEACEFRVVRHTDRLVFHDPINSCLGSCGARGTFDGDDRFRLGERRPIRYLDRLLASREFEAAVAAREGRIRRPETYLLPERPAAASRSEGRR